MLKAVRKHAVPAIVAFVVAMVAAGAPAIAAIINADKLNGYKANQLTRVAEDHADANALVGVSGSAAYTTITAPKPGYLFIVAGADVWSPAAAFDNYYCAIVLDGTYLSSSERVVELDASTNEDDCSTNAAWPVGKGLHTVDFQFFGVAATTTVDESSLQVIFSPFNSTGGAVTPVVPTSPDSGDGGNNG